MASDMTMQNSIPADQNAEPQIKLLRAQRATYSRAKTVVIWQIILTLAIPTVGSLITLVLPDLKPAVAFASLTIAILDIAILDRLQKRLLLVGARIQEQFDCNILSLPWNKFLAGSPVEPETVHAAATRYARKNDDSSLRDWYPLVVGNAPPHLARIVCQRTNLWYDSKLRTHYGTALLATAVLLALFLFGIGMVEGLTLSNFVLSVMAPATPFVGWAVREYYRQKDVADALNRVRITAEALWDNARAGNCGTDECEEQSREFQNAIFARRSTSPPIFGWVYWIMRSANEDQMNVGAEEMIKQIL